MKAVIFNADDFGATPKINAAVRRAHTDGVLTSASLMVNEPAAAEAVEIARSHPTLAVGLHVTLSEGHAALSHRDIPHLTNNQQRFCDSPAAAGMVYFFSRAARQEVAREVEEQFRRFAMTGLSFSHVDGHRHLHLHPVVWDAVIAQCEAYGVRRIRIPYEEFRPATRERLAARWLEWLVFRALRRRCLRRLQGRGFCVADRVYGHLETGCMNICYLLNLLEHLGGKTNEIYLHPGSVHARPVPSNSSGMDVELEALLHPSLKQRINELGLKLATYQTLN